MTRLQLALAVASLAFTLLLSCAPASPPPPDLILIVVDTLRADRLSCYGYPGRTSPHLDSLAARGMRFANASSTSGWTVPAHASLFTGLYPIQHRATQERPHLTGAVPTLAELLGARGYATLAVSANPLVGPPTGLHRGFERYESSWRAAGDAAAGHPVAAAAQRLVGDVAPGRPLFLFANLMETHHPYAPPPESWTPAGLSPDDPSERRARGLSPGEWYLDAEAADPGILEALSAVYDGSVAAADAAVGELLEALDREGRLDGALLVVTSDHGEALGDLGHLRHVFQLHSSVTHVPLIVVPPGGAERGSVQEEPVSLVDVFATLLAAAGTPVPRSHPGVDLLGRLPRDRTVFAEYYYPVQALSNLPAGLLKSHPASFARFRRRLRSAEQGEYRLIASSSGERQLFHVRGDRRELEDRAGEPQLGDAESRLWQQLQSFGRPRPLAGDEPSLEDEVFGPLDLETERQLRELGYIRE